MTDGTRPVDPDDDVRVDRRAWPDILVDNSRERRWASRVGPSVFAVFLAPDVVNALHLGRPALPVVAFSAAYGLSYLAVWWLVWKWAPRWRLVWVGWLIAVGIAAGVAMGPGESWAMLGYALSSTLVLVPVQVAVWIGRALIVGVLASGLVVHRAVDWASVVTLVLVFLTVSGIVRMSLILSALRAARSEVRELAVAGERARLARDLHDVLGHSLTTITVKTALARRLVESGADAERVRDELRDAEELSRRALADIRATVSGQRRMSLAAELVSARAALRAAGIEADLPQAVDDVLAPLEEPLAYVLREGVTNVVRHSGASRCTVRLGPRWLEVSDNGAGPDRPAMPGNGLVGLRERMAAVRGRVETEAVPGGGFRLRAQAEA